MNQNFRRFSLPRILSRTSMHVQSFCLQPKTTVNIWIQEDIKPFSWEKGGKYGIK